MPSLASEHRDPAVAAVLSAVVPGLGLIYAGAARAGVAVLVAELLLYTLGWGVLLVPLHLWQVLAAGGTAAVRGERRRDVLETRRAVNPVDPA